MRINVPTGGVGAPTSRRGGKHAERLLALAAAHSGGAEGRRAGADVDHLAYVREVALDVAVDARAAAVGAGAVDELRAAQQLVALEARVQLARVVVLAPPNPILRGGTTLWRCTRCCPRPARPLPCPLAPARARGRAHLYSTHVNLHSARSHMMFSCGRGGGAPPGEGRARRSAHAAGSRTTQHRVHSEVRLTCLSMQSFTTSWADEGLHRAHRRRVLRPVTSAARGCEGGEGGPEAQLAGRRTVSVCRVSL